MYSKNFFDLDHTIAKELFKSIKFVWEVLPKISEYILKLGKALPEKIYEEVSPNVWIAKNAQIANTAQINGPTIICEDTQIRHCAFIRGNAIVGKNAVVGNSTELKNVILFDNVQVPHYNYVGDSVLGYKAHMGAGAITSNVKSDRSDVYVKSQHALYKTGLRKFGAIIGDHVEIGCNSVLNPGTVIGKNSIIYPLSSVRGYIPEMMIYKDKNNIVSKRNN